MTSFTSEPDCGHVDYPKLIDTDLNTLDFVEAQKLSTVSAKLEREHTHHFPPPSSSQNKNRLSQSSHDTKGSTSTYGSVDEDELLQTSLQIEHDPGLPAAAAISPLEPMIPPVLPSVKGTKEGTIPSPVSKVPLHTYTPNMV